MKRGLVLAESKKGTGDTPTAVSPGAQEARGLHWGSVRHSVGKVCRHVWRRHRTEHARFEILLLHTSHVQKRWSREFRRIMR